MHAIRHDEKSKKKLHLVVMHFHSSFPWKITSEVFFFYNLNVKPPDVCLMLEEPRLCEVLHYLAY